MNTETLCQTDITRALDQSVILGIKELLPDAEVDICDNQPDTADQHSRQACLIAISGQITGSLALVLNTDAASEISHQIIIDGLGENPDDLPKDELIQLEESAICELCNRIAAKFLSLLSPSGNYRMSFPVFFNGDDIKLIWDYPIQTTRLIKLDDISFAISFGIGEELKTPGSPADRLRVFDDILTTITEEHS